MTLKISISFNSKKRLIETWGPEVILRCSCGDIPSHSMWGQYGHAKCPVCKQICETIPYDWGIVDG